MAWILEIGKYQININSIIAMLLFVVAGFSFGMVKGINIQKEDCSNAIVDAFLVNPDYDDCFGYRRDPDDPNRLISPYGGSPKGDLNMVMESYNISITED